MCQHTRWTPPLPFDRISLTRRDDTPPTKTTRNASVDGTLTSQLHMSETGAWKGVMLMEAAKTNGILLLDAEDGTPPSDGIVDVDTVPVASYPAITVKRRDGTVETWATRVLITPLRDTEQQLLDFPDELAIRVDPERPPTLDALAQMIFDICDRPTACESCGTHDIGRAIECAYMAACQALHGKERAYEWLIENTLRNMTARWGRPERSHEIHLEPSAKISPDIRIT